MVWVDKRATRAEREIQVMADAPQDTTNPPTEVSSPSADDELEINIVLEYTLAEWIEMNRASLSRRQRVLLSLAEGSSLPLALLTGTVVATLILRLFGLVIPL